MKRPRVTSLEDLWAVRLGVDSGQTVDELQARFEHLSQFVLIGGIPPAGKAGAVSAEAAAAHGDLWVLAGFLADARQLLTSQEDR